MNSKMNLSLIIEPTTNEPNKGGKSYEENNW